MERTKQPHTELRLCSIVMVIALLLTTMQEVGARQIDDGVSSESGDEIGRTGEVELRVETSGAVTTSSLTADWEAFLLDLQRDMTTIAGTTPQAPLVIRFVGSLPDDSDGGTAVADSVVINDGATVAIIGLDHFLSLPDSEASNLLRNLLARRWLVDASGGAMPAPLVDGFAHYLESPVLARQARQASLAQQSYLDDELPTWSEIIASPDATASLDPDVAHAARLAVAAFLVERYGASVIADLARSLEGEANDPIAAVVEVTGQPRERLDDGWEDFIAVWFAGGWRNNAFAALDLEPARDLFSRGAYEASVDSANQTLQVTTALNDTPASAEAEMVVAQGSVGMQAEALMGDAEAALQAHDYSRALTLIDRAEDQYALLPEDHRPESLIETWRGITADGLAAIDNLNEANTSFEDWFSMRSARSDAVAAGSTFAGLGDTERLALAELLVADLDTRFQRLGLALGSAILVLAGWLLIWSWHRSPGRIRWPGLTDLARQEGLR